MKKIIRKVIESKNLKKITAFLKENKKTTLAMLVLAIFIDIFFVKESSDFVIFSFLFFYGMLVKTHQIKSKSTFLLCLALLVAMFINFLFTDTSVSTEKAAVWLILFLGFGIIQQWKE